jgi:hypothetical protein
MSVLERKRKPPTVSILARVTADEREALRVLAWEEGCNSVSSWLRQQIVQRLKAAEVREPRREPIGEAR